MKTKTFNWLLFGTAAVVLTLLAGFGFLLNGGTPSMLKYSRVVLTGIATWIWALIIWGLLSGAVKLVGVSIWFVVVPAILMAAALAESVVGGGYVFLTLAVVAAIPTALVIGRSRR